MSVLAPNFQYLFESLPALYLVLNPDLTIAAVTDTYLQATKTQRQNILGRTLFDVFPDNPDDLQATGTRNLRASLNRVRQEGIADTMAVQKYDIRRPESEGGGYEERFWSPINSPLFNEQGQLQYIIHRVEDVTEFIYLKQRGFENEKLTTELQHLVEKTETEVYLRAQEVSEVNRLLYAANADLAQLNEKMQELDQLKTHFFTNVSHELRTPLTLILSPLKSLLASHLDERTRCALLVIERNARLLLKHVNDLLDVAKIDAGKMEIHVESTNLSQLLECVASYFDVLAQEKSINYIVNAEQNVQARIEPEKIQRILLNILSNAFKFTPVSGQIRCCLRADYQQCHAIIEIADSGIGIQPEQRESIFTAFHQIDSGLNRNFAGTGLGLAIAREFAEVHGGTLDVSNAPEGGALFRLLLPIQAISQVQSTDKPILLIDAAINALAEFQSQQSVVTIKQQLTVGPLVLVIEDNVELNQFLCDNLACDYRVASALNGQEGLNKIASLRPDLTLCDVMMPEMSGDMLLQQVRANSALDTMPILLLSARADDEFRIRLLKAGAQDYLLKPFLLDELRARVRNLVNTKLAEDNNRQLTKDLQQRNLHLQALMKDLETANQELESFSYSVSHDLRSPLRAIDGFSHRLAQRAADKLDEEETRLLNVVRHSSKKMGQLIDDLLHFSKVSRVDLRCHATDMNALVQEVWQEISESYQGTISIEPLPAAVVDRALLVQVWSNLLANAIKYSSKVSHAHIVVTGESSETEHLYHVRDNGAGFDMRFVHKLFVVFQRLHSDAAFSGTGVGLAIVARIIGRHGGRVWAEGQVDKGAVIHFSLPRKLE